jgi:hypothetical protein
MYNDHHKFNVYFFSNISYLVSRGIVVDIATGYGLDDRGVGGRVPVGSRSPRRSDRFWGPPNFLPNGYRGIFPRVKRPRREADHPPPESSEVKKV